LRMKKAIFMGTALVVTASLAAACSKTDEKPAETASPSKVSDGIDQPTTLTFYNIARDSEAQFNDTMGDAIRKKFPNLTIHYVERGADKGTDLSSYLPSGEPIDIIWGSIGSWPGAVPAYELGYDMTDLIKKYNVDLSRVEPSLIEAMKQMSGGNQLWGVPIFNSSNVIVYNKDIFDKFGVPYPKDGMTYDDLHSLALKLNREADGVQYTGYSASTSYTILMNPYSVPMIDPKTGRSTYDTDSRWPKIIETEMMQFARESAYQAVAQQYRKKITPLTADQFLKDKVLAMTIAGPLWPIVLKDQLKEMNWNFVAMPTFPDLPGVGDQSYPTYMSIPSISKNKDAAMKVIKYLVSDEFQLDTSKKGNMTVLTNKEIQKAMGQDGFFKGINYGAFFYNKFAPIANDDRNLATKTKALYAIDYDSLMNGSKDINTMLRDAAEKVNKAIEAENSK